MKDKFLKTAAITPDIKVGDTDFNTENIIKAKEFLDEKGVNIFNSDDTFFSDICIPYTDEKGNDIILPDRNKDICQLSECPLCRRSAFCTGDLQRRPRRLEQKEKSTQSSRYT